MKMNKIYRADRRGNVADGGAVLVNVTEGLCAALFVAMDSEIHASSANQVSCWKVGRAVMCACAQSCMCAEFATTRLNETDNICLLASHVP